MMGRLGLVGVSALCVLAACAGARSASAAPGDALWSATVPLPRTDHPEAHYYGQQVTISGDTIVVGADDATFEDANDQGAAYVYARAGTSWAQAQLLRGNPGAKNGLNGAVALDGDTLLVGGSLEETRGAAYVFVHEQTWVRQGPPIVSPNPGAPDQFGDFDWFGSAVAVSGDTAVVGARNQIINGISEGAAFVFVRQAGVWTPQGAMLQAPDGTGSAAFGATVAIDGDTILVGAPHNPYLNTVGAAYIFVRQGLTWVQQGPALRSGLSSGDEFGGALSLSGDTALIGAQSAFAEDGAVYAFSRSAGHWKKQGAPLRPLRGQQANVGSAVAIQGDRAVFAARSAGSNVAARWGTLFAYARGPSGAWCQQGTPNPVADASEDLAVGQSVGLSGVDVVVGALGIQQGHGAAFALQVTTDPGSCLDVEQAGAAGESSASGAAGEAGFATGGSAGFGVAGAGVGGSNTGGSSAGSPSGGSVQVAIPSSGTPSSDSSASGASGMGGALAALDDDDRAVAACGCRMGDRTGEPRSLVLLGLLALACLRRKNARR